MSYNCIKMNPKYANMDKEFSKLINWCQSFYILLLFKRKKSELLGKYLNVSVLS